jgi:NSS family neurotransmitter:Na+ symporter
MNYFVFSFGLDWGSDTGSFFMERFLQGSGSPFVLGGIRWPILAGTAVTWFLCWFICYREVSHGIEKASMIFMPLLVVLTLCLVGWSLQLEGAWDAVKEHYLRADWSRIDPLTAAGRKVWVAAFGQIFFTLSLGFGIMVTYASYLPKKTDIVGNALITCVLNCLYSFITGFAVFGTIGFMANAKGVPFAEAIAGGPGLAFVVYPEAINQLPVGNRIFGALFFLVLIVAGMSSAISLTEAFACSICDKFNLARKRAVSWICGIGFAGSIVFCTQAGLYILDVVDHFINNYALIIGGVVECLLVGWVVKSGVIRRHVNGCGGLKLPFLWDLAIRVVTPAILLVILGGALVAEFQAPYSGYPVKALVLVGGGILLVTLMGSFCLSRFAWKAGKLDKRHNPEDETLLT